MDERRTAHQDGNANLFRHWLHYTAVSILGDTCIDTKNHRLSEAPLWEPDKSGSHT
ncbi:MAG: hypothetical protein Q8O64_20645 [Sideroxyarcus sp.]|nr:hypothetical protein [Sideroxyarcus sp.]